MKKALIISHSVQSAQSLAQLLKIESFSQTSIADNSKTAKKLVENDEFDLICINAPLAEESGIELSMHFAKVTRSSVVIIVPQKNADDVNDALTEHGVLVTMWRQFPARTPSALPSRCCAPMPSRPVPAPGRPCTRQPSWWPTASAARPWPCSAADRISYKSERTSHSP